MAGPSRSILIQQALISNSARPETFELPMANSAASTSVIDRPVSPSAKPKMFQRAP